MMQVLFWLLAALPAHCQFSVTNTGKTLTSYGTLDSSVTYDLSFSMPAGTSITGGSQMKLQFQPTY